MPSVPGSGWQGLVLRVIVCRFSEHTRVLSRACITFTTPNTKDVLEDRGRSQCRPPARPPRGNTARDGAACAALAGSPPPAPPCAAAPQAIVTREELHAQQARSLQEKDVLRKQVRELSEKVDELQLQLFQREGQLLALEDRLRRQQLDTPVLVGLPGVGGPSVRATPVPPWGPGLCPLWGRCVPRDRRGPRRSRRSPALPEPPPSCWWAQGLAGCSGCCDGDREGLWPGASLEGGLVWDPSPRPPRKPAD